MVACYYRAPAGGRPLTRLDVQRYVGGAARAAGPLIVRVPAFVDDVMCEISRECDRLYVLVGRPLQLPERLLLVRWLRIVCSIRSERLR